MTNERNEMDTDQLDPLAAEIVALLQQRRVPPLDGHIWLDEGRITVTKKGVATIPGVVLGQQPGGDAPFVLTVTRV